MKLRSIYLCGINTSPTEPPPQPLNFLRGQSLLDLNQSRAWMDRNPGQEMLGRRIGGGEHVVAFCRGQRAMASLSSTQRACGTVRGLHQGDPLCVWLWGEAKVA